MAKERYFLGTSGQEFKRLKFQHDTFLPSSLDLLRRANIKKGQTWLDVGCGPGLMCGELGKLVGKKGKVFGIDKAPHFLELARKQSKRQSQLSYEEQDLRKLNLDSIGRFDGVFGRWVTLFLPDPKATLAVLAKNLKKGGHLVFQEYVNFRGISFVPGSSAFDRLAAAVIEAYRSSGNNASGGESLPGVFRELGLKIVHMEAFVQPARPGEPFWEWFKQFSFQFGPQFVKQDILSRTEFSQYKKEFLRREKAKEGFLLTPPLLGIIGKK